MPHVYVNPALDYFVAESLDDAKVVARVFYVGEGGIMINVKYLDLKEVPDTEIIEIDEDEEAKVLKVSSKTAAEWAVENGRGWLCSEGATSS